MTERRKLVELNIQIYGCKVFVEVTEDRGEHRVEMVERQIEQAFELRSKYPGTFNGDTSQ